MSFTREALKKVFGDLEGITDEMVNTIMSMHGRDIEANKVNLNDYVSKTDYDALNGKLTAKQKELDDLIKSNADKEKNTAISQAISTAKGKNEKAILALLDSEKITFKDGKLEGVEGQLKELQKSDSYLFDLAEKPAAVPAKDESGAKDNFIADMQKL